MQIRAICSFYFSSKWRITGGLAGIRGANRSYFIPFQEYASNKGCKPLLYDRRQVVKGERPLEPSTSGGEVIILPADEMFSSIGSESNDFIIELESDFNHNLSGFDS